MTSACVPGREPLTFEKHTKSLSCNSYVYEKRQDGKDKKTLIDVLRRGAFGSLGSNQITTHYSAGSLETQQSPCLPQNATTKQGWVARLGGNASAAFSFMQILLFPY
jgi:hypothetical protein